MTDLKTLMLLFVLVPAVLAKKGARSNTDVLTRARCDLFCLETSADAKVQCRNKCRLNNMKPGTCPTSDSPKWADACVEACNSDGHCEGVQRCCRFSCGSTCADPVNLLSLPGLPAVPVISNIKEKRRSVIVIWNDGVGDSARAVPGKVIYIVQEQHHLGPKYEEARLSEWSFLTRTNKTKLSLRKLLKPGRWYRFRVAAVNASGTRGFSAPSAPFTPRRGPKPPAPPKRLKIQPLKSDNGTFTVRLEWREPKSDLPILKYKVFWSRRLRGLSGELDSVVVNHLTVPKNQTHLDIKDLQPDSMYFFQVQSISFFGLGKLRSEKVHIFFNTTSSTGNASRAQELVKRDDKNVTNSSSGIKLHDMLWTNHKLKANISWKPFKTNQHPTRYFVHWRALKCEKNKNKDLLASTDHTSFEIYELDYDCIYEVQVTNTYPKRNNFGYQLVFNVPTCQILQQRAKRNFTCGT